MNDSTGVQTDGDIAVLTTHVSELFRIFSHEWRKIVIFLLSNGCFRRSS